MKIWKWFLRTFWKNFGMLDRYKNIYRSGQLGPLRFLVTLFILKPEVIIALHINSYGKKSDSRLGANKFDRWRYDNCRYFERWFLRYWTNIHYFCYHLSSQRDVDPVRLITLLSTLEHLVIKDKKVWVHCGAGRDRTNAFLGLWFLGFGRGSIYHWLDLCKIHGFPPNGWIEEILRTWNIKQQDLTKAGEIIMKEYIPKAMDETYNIEVTTKPDRMFTNRQGARAHFEDKLT